MGKALNQLSSNIWVSQSQFANISSGIFYSGEHHYLVDPGILPAEIDALAEYVQDQQGDINALILTHSHWDHLHGPEHFPNVKIIAQENYLTVIEGKAGQQIIQQVEMLSDHFELQRKHPFVIPEPDRTFRDMLDLPFRNGVLQLIHAPGHAPDQLVIYLSENGTLWAGDMLSDLEIPYIIDSLPAYLQTLSLMADLEIACLVPGHGTPTREPAEIQARLEEDQAYLNRMEEQVSRAVETGLNSADTLEICAGFDHPCLEENANAHQLNIETVYLELGGKGGPDKIGWSQDFD